MDLVKQIEQCGDPRDRNGTTLKEPVVITDCGEIA
jgi:hypothetical protein